MTNELITITEYDEFREKMDEVKEGSNFLPDVSTDEGYLKSKRVSLDVGKILTSLEKKRKEKKADSIAEGKRIDSEASTIREALEVLQLPHKEAYKQLDNALKDRETARKAELEERVRVIREIPTSMRDSDSAGVQMALETLNADECLDFYEYANEALKARNASKEALGVMFADKLKAEKEAAELAKLRKEAAGREQKEREEAIAREAREAAEREAQEAKIKEEAAKAFAKLAEEAKAKAEEQAKIDAENAEKARIAAEKQAKKDADVAAAMAKQREIDAQAEREEAVRLDLEKREANKKHVGAIRRAAKESIMAVGFSESDAKKLVTAIYEDKIANVSISY